MLWPYVTSPGKFPPRVPGPTFRGRRFPGVNWCVVWGIRRWLNLRVAAVSKSEGQFCWERKIIRKIYNENICWVNNLYTWGKPIKLHCTQRRFIYSNPWPFTRPFQQHSVSGGMIYQTGGWWALSTEPLLILVSKKSCTLKTQQHASIAITSMDLCQVLPRTTGLPSETLSRELDTNLSALSCSKPFLGKIKNFASPSASFEEGWHEWNLPPASLLHWWKCGERQRNKLDNKTYIQWNFDNKGVKRYSSILCTLHLPDLPSCTEEKCQQLQQ